MNWRRAGWLAVMAGLLPLAGCVWGQGSATGPSAEAPPEQRAEYAGSELCMACHRAATPAVLATYEQTVLQSFGQVADVLDALNHDAELLTEQKGALDAAQASRLMAARDTGAIVTLVRPDRG